MCLSGITSDNSRLPCYGISFGILSGIRGYCIFSLSVWHSISSRRLWSRSGGHHSDPGFAVEVRRGEEDKKEERSGWYRISQPGTCRWRDNTNKVKKNTWKHDTGSTVPVRYGVLFNQRAWSRGMKFQRFKKWVNLNHLNLSVWTEPLIACCSLQNSKFLYNHRKAIHERRHAK